MMLVVLSSKSAHAVPPPEFIIQIASQIGNFFSIGLVFLLAILTTGYQFIKTRMATISKKVYWIVGVIVAILVAGLGAYYLNQYYQDRAQQQVYCDDFGACLGPRSAGV